jgi:hypothetical protein
MAIGWGNLNGAVTSNVVRTSSRLYLDYCLILKPLSIAQETLRGIGKPWWMANTARRTETLQRLGHGIVLGKSLPLRCTARSSLKRSIYRNWLDLLRHLLDFVEEREQDSGEWTKRRSH